MGRVRRTNYNATGDQVSGNTFRRNLRKGEVFKSLSLSLLQWAAIAEVTGVSLTELTRRFKNQENSNFTDGG